MGVTGDKRYSIVSITGGNNHITIINDHKMFVNDSIRGVI